MSVRDSLRTSNVRIVAHTVAELQLIQAAVMAASSIVPLLFWEPYQVGIFLLSAVVTALVAGSVYFSTDTVPEPDIEHAMVIAGAGWLVTAAFGALPFLFTAYLTPPDVIASYLPVGAGYQSSVYYFQNPLHALFEGMSGWTTTGLTMAVHEPSLPHGLLWWRSVMQWAGGLGVILLTLTVLRQTGEKSNYLLYQSEAREQKLRPSVLGTLKELWQLYAGITAGAAVYLSFGIAILLDVSIWHALWSGVTHAMTGISTGGFSILDGSIGEYSSAAVELLFVPVMVAGAVSYPVYYAVIRERDWGKPLRSPQTRWLFILLGIGTPVLSILNAQTMAWERALRVSIFHYVSGLSTAGFQAASIGTWGPSAVVFIVAGAMIVGGCAGATVGGLKILRAYVLARGAFWQINRVFKPEHAVVDMWLGEEHLDYDRMVEEFMQAGVITVLYLVLLTLSLIVLLSVVPDKFTVVDVLFEVASAQSTVGLSSGISGPTMPVAAEVAIILQMWLGRLEILPVLVFVRTLVVGFEH